MHGFIGTLSLAKHLIPYVYYPSLMTNVGVHLLFKAIRVIK